MFSAGITVLVSEMMFMMSLEEVWSIRVRIGGSAWRVGVRD